MCTPGHAQFFLHLMHLMFPLYTAQWLTLTPTGANETISRGPECDGKRSAILLGQRFPINAAVACGCYVLQLAVRDICWGMPSQSANLTAVLTPRSFVPLMELTGFRPPASQSKTLLVCWRHALEIRLLALHCSLLMFLESRSSVPFHIRNLFRRQVRVV